MFGFLGCSEGTILLTVVPSGFDMGTGINLLLCGLASVMVITTTASTAPPTGTTLSNGKDASADCPGVFLGGCSPLEYCVVIFHLVK